MVRGRTGTVGKRAERLAQRYLANRGLQLIKANYRCRLGEIDLIMSDKNCLVFVEVRFRSGRKLTAARNTVDRHKRRKLVRTAATFLATSPQYANCSVRFDVVGIDATTSGAQRIDWLRDAFRPSDASL